VFAIGVSLRGARESRGLRLADVERQTRVHERYLRALEEEDFDQLPPGGYRRTFLRGYATFLGLDADEFVDAYADRYEHAEVAPIVVPTLRRRGRRPRAWLGVVAAAIAALLIWVVPAHNKARPISSLATTQSHAAAVHPRHRLPVRRSRLAAAASVPTRVHVKLAASLGNCWVSVRLGGPQGRLLYENVLTQGQRLLFRATKLWVRLGAPTALTLEINGKPQTLPAQTGNILIDAQGARSTT
jgi:cytoskeleton protein RodZ